jgi:outer membrane protein assembly factor BamA
MQQADAVHSRQLLMHRAARHLVLILLALACVLPCISRRLAAQTYKPKTIVFQSTDASQHIDSAELLRISGLQQGVPLTKSDIQGALQKLGDTGIFSNLSYTVNDAALTIRLTPAGGGQALPVRFANFVWWPPDDLLKILEARIPLFTGTLPLQSNQTGEVEDALVALLSGKGIPDARITAMLSTRGGTVDGVILSITSPEILVGQTHFTGSLPAVDPKLNTLNREIVDRDFDLQDYIDTIRNSVQEIFADAGYLDIANDPPVFSPPRKTLGRYAVDAEVALHPGALYRVGTIAIHPEPPVSEAELRAALLLKYGDPASASDLRVAGSTLARVYSDRAFLDAKASATVDKIPSNHTVNYSFTFSPGTQYRLAAVDASALPADLQQEFAGLWHVAPGALMDKSVLETLRQTAKQLHTRYGIFVGAKRDPLAHTIVLVLQLRKLPAVDPGSSEPFNAAPSQ